MFLQTHTGATLRAVRPACVGLIARPPHAACISSTPPTSSMTNPPSSNAKHPNSLPNISDNNAPSQKPGSPNQPELTAYQINSLTQGHVLDERNKHKRDTQCQSVAAGLNVRQHGSDSPLDAANAEHGMKQDRPWRGVRIGNPEGVGFVEQVGSASATARKFEGEDIE